MRDIKFRGWDGENMYTPSDSHKYANAIFWSFYEIAKTQKEKECIFLMQYTGLLDQKAKEVYEGDIINYLTSENCIREIVFENSAFHARPHGYVKGDPTHPLFFTTLGQWGEFEVIGNIYETPNLLT